MARAARKRSNRRPGKENGAATIESQRVSLDLIMSLSYGCLNGRVEMIEHPVDYDACDRDVEPDWQGPAGKPFVAG